MSFQAKIIADSLAPCGMRLTTMTLTYPRFIHAEILTHRDRARNSASSRAIPWPKMRAAITEDPVVPIKWGAEQKGMQTGDEVADPAAANKVWLAARDLMLAKAQELADLGVHKSLCNRLTEPWMWITVVMTATFWKNFFRLRVHPDAEIHFQKIAGMAKEILEASTPRELKAGAWHLPFVPDEEIESRKNMEDPVSHFWPKVSTARCARVSYLTHEGTHDPMADLKLFDRLVQGSGFGHWSPHEHPARALANKERSGPFVGFQQFRKFFPQETADDE